MEEKLHFPVHVWLQAEFPRKLQIISRFALRSSCRTRASRLFFCMCNICTSNFLDLVFGISRRSVITLHVRNVHDLHCSHRLKAHASIFARDASRAIGLFVCGGQAPLEISLARF